jgi:3-phosphoshikimate 1-carboxyvinyltransferase
VNEGQALSDVIIKRAGKLQGLLTIPGDKSISHRAALISLLCSDIIDVSNFSDGVDCRQSLDAARKLGGDFEKDGAAVRLTPPEGGALQAPAEPIDCGNSGTTIRLLSGLLAGSGISASLTGDESLRSRPMKRIVDPLQEMNASINASDDGVAPLEINPGSLIPIDYTMPISSAQVKSCLLLAGLASGNKVTVREKMLTRDHTERMINHLRGSVDVEDVVVQMVPDPSDPRKKKKVLPTDEYKRTISLSPSGLLSGGEIDIPGDISTAAYFMAAALIVPGSHVILHNVGLNPTRNAFINVMRQMGAEIAIKNRRERSGEPSGDIEVSYSKLKPRKISGQMIPNLIDEIPILGALAASMEGTTIVRDAGELRHKESDRIQAVVDNLKAMGVKVGEFPDGFAVEGTGEINGAEIDSRGDHRIAMAFAVAGLAGHGQTVIHNSDCAAVSCPQFFTMLEGLRVK